MNRQGDKEQDCEQPGSGGGDVADNLGPLSPCRPVSLSPFLIWLVGYRGSGKTTVARLLAEKLGWQWADADEVLEARCGRRIRQVFAEEGEQGFREKETDVLRELAGSRQHVIATGGGAVVRPGNRELLRGGTVIWLRADAPTLWQRLAQDAATVERRPDLTVGGLEEVRALLQEREPLYGAVADQVVDTVGRSPEEVANEILSLLPGIAPARGSLPP